PAVSCLLCSLSASAAGRALRSFPTRRSSDLDVAERLARLAGEVVEDVAGDQAALLDGDRGEAGERLAGLLFEVGLVADDEHLGVDRKSTRLNSSHVKISYAVFCLKKKKAEAA